MHGNGSHHEMLEDHGRVVSQAYGLTKSLVAYRRAPQSLHRQPFQMLVYGCQEWMRTSPRQIAPFLLSSLP